MTGLEARARFRVRSPETQKLPPSGKISLKRAARRPTCMTNTSALPKTIALVRIATSVFFLFFGEYKVGGPGFAHGGFQNYLHDYISTTAVSFYRPFLSGLVLPHAVFFGYVVGIVELLIGMCLLIGLWVRPACVLGVLFLANMLLATWWGPGHGVAFWRYFGAEL